MSWTILSFVQNLLRGPYGLNPMIFWSKFCKKAVSVEPFCLFFKIFRKGNMGWTIWSFDQNFSKGQYAFNCIIFWLKFSSNTIRIKRYCPLFKVCLKENISWTLLCFGQTFRNKGYMGLNIFSFVRSLLKRQY